MLKPKAFASLIAFSEARRLALISLFVCLVSFTNRVGAGFTALWATDLAGLGLERVFFRANFPEAFPDPFSSSFSGRLSEINFSFFHILKTFWSDLVLK
jgi:hypothetical protein